MKTRSSKFGPSIRQMLVDGYRNYEIADTLGVSRASVSYHAKQLGLKFIQKPSYDWAEIQSFYDGGHSIRECTDKFGCALRTIYGAIETGRFRTRPKAKYRTAQDLIDEYAGRYGRSIRWKIKEKILKENIFPYRCAICGISDWMGSDLSLRLDHINGDNRNHSIDNLRLLCPNCDSQQETYCHRNVGRYGRPPPPDGFHD